MENLIGCSIYELDTIESQDDSMDGKFNFSPISVNFWTKVDYTILTAATSDSADVATIFVAFSDQKIQLHCLDHLGIMDHEEARRKNAGGKVLGFFY
ncbi:40S ribosomal protein S15a-1 [Tanacetum coccineum]